MANKIRRLVLAAVMTVTMVVGLAGGLTHVATAAVPSTHHVQLVDYCPVPPFACSVTRLH